jgi:hypothetical protein
MKNNNNSIELQSNFKPARVEVDLANLLIDHCLKKKKIVITISMIETKSEEHIYKKIKKKKKKISNQLTIGVTQ